MPLTVPTIDDRRYQDLVRDTLARVPVHTPEWTQLAESDPGVTLVELFAFLTESLLYRANRVPEVARAKFLRLLGVALAPATSAQGLVTFDGARLDVPAPTLPAQTELRGGAVAFRTRRAIDVLPLSARAFVKFRVTPSAADQAYYDLLYDSAGVGGATIAPYETRELDGRTPFALGADTADGALWIALLAPPRGDPRVAADAVAGKTLSLGLVPYVDEQPKTLAAVGQVGAAGDASALVGYALPNVVPPADGSPPAATYQPLLPASADDVLAAPGVVELVLPAKGSQITHWVDLDPLESGVGGFPPALDDSALAARIVTWLRIKPSASAGAKFLWAGINAAAIEQRVAVRNELVGEGDGQPDQVYALARRGVVDESLAIDVVESSGVTHWAPIDDLMAAGPEVRAASALRPPSEAWTDPRATDVFAVDAEAGRVRFGDGLRGRRPPRGARIVARYDVCDGRAGNVAAGAVNAGPGLPPGIKPSNPIATWGGADAEDAGEGEKRVASFIRHRDRLVTADDFEAIALRAPGADIARVEVLAAWHPDLGDTQPGDAPGVVTLMVVPRNDPRAPDAPLPDRALIDALCRHLDPRRLVTTELVLRGAQYMPFWISVGIAVAGGYAVPDVRDRVKARLRALLAPARTDGATDLPGFERGWPLARAVNRLELWAEIARVAGVLRVNEVLLAAEDGSAITTEQRLYGIQLPRIAGLSVESGEPVPIATLLGTAGGDGTGGAAADTSIVPVPTVPAEC